MIMHPIKPELNGKDLAGSVDANGKNLFVEMSKVSNQNKAGGLVKYWWDKPGTKGALKRNFHMYKNLNLGIG